MIINKILCNENQMTLFDQKNQPIPPVRILPSANPKLKKVKKLPYLITQKERKKKEEKK